MYIFVQLTTGDETEEEEGMEKIYSKREREVKIIIKLVGNGKEEG